MSPVRHDRRGEALWITIDRAEKRNAINPEVIAGIAAGYRRVEEDPSIRALVLTGAGEKAFCAGGDLKPGGGFDFDYAVPTAPLADLFRLADLCPVPTVARINGACLAGGMGLLCMTDLAVAAADAIFGLPEVRIGLFPFQVMVLLQRLVPPRVIRDWALSGESFGAEAALAHGLVNEIAAPGQLDAAVEKLLARITDKSPQAQRRGKYALRALRGMGFEDGLAFAESQLPLMALSDDAQEGMAAFNEKRKPAWKGRSGSG